MHDGVEVSDQPNIPQVVHNNYSHLYQEKAISNEAVNTQSQQSAVNYRHRTEIFATVRYRSRTLIPAALKEMKTNKSLGLDGLSTQFYRSFWSCLRSYNAWELRPKQLQRE